MLYCNHSLDNASASHQGKKASKFYPVLASGIALITLSVAAAFPVAAYVSRTRNELREEARTEALNSLQISFRTDDEGKEVRQFEYGSGEINLLDLVVSHSGDLMVSGDATLDTGELGKKEIVYTLQTTDSMGGEVEWSVYKSYEVVDTQAPAITLSQDSVSLYVGDSFDAGSYVSSVKDPVDGDLTKSDTLEKGTYTVSTDYADEEGSYTVTVKAMDRHGNISTQTMDVTVSAKPAYTASYAAAGSSSGYSASEGNYGYVSIPSIGYGAPLNWTQDFDTLQHYIDCWGSAGCTNIYGPSLSIFDHAYQGLANLSGISTGTVCYVTRGGVTTTYVCVSKYYTDSLGYTSDGSFVYDLCDTSMTIQTCVPGGDVITYWAAY